MGPIQSLADLLSMVRRRLPVIMTILILGLLISLFLAVSSPPAYEARAVIQVNAPLLAESRGSSTPPASLRVQQIEQRLMSRENLLRLIETYDLFADAPGLPESAKLEVLRENTSIISVASSAATVDPNAGLSSIIISARAGDGKVAANIANDLSEDVVTSDRRNRAARVAKAREVLVQEQRHLEADLDKHDREIADFVTVNEDSLTESRSYLQSELVGLTSRETSTEQSLMELQRDRAELEQNAATNGSLSIVQQLRAAEVALAQARRTLSAGHPEIQRLEQTISDLSAGNADTTVAGLGRQIELIDRQITNLNTDLEEIRARRLEIKTAQDRSPEVMQVYIQMQRARQSIQDQYDDLSRRLAEVESLRLLSENDQTENMVILERAFVPEFPLASNRKRSAILGAFLSIAAAGGIALLLEMMNPVLRNAQQFEAIAGLRPLASLPYQLNERDQFRRSLSIVYLIVICVLGLIAVIWMLDIMPEWLAQFLPAPINHNS